MNRRDAPDLAGTIGLGAWMAFGILTVVMVDQDGPSPWMDDGFLSWSAGHRPDALLALARAVTDSGTGAIPYVLAAGTGVMAGRAARHRLMPALVSLVCLGAGQAVRYGVMEVVHRPRPPHAG
ncbi:hypothetical protein OHB00_01725 [Streptomyces sp. NBC_00631]|uniref:hypothetical protein n=1 Tax=Streptomyces sp. NBC_00631 TaxID=2975793 RepID=UPI0030DF9D70